MTDESNSQQEIEAHLAKSASNRQRTLLLGGGVGLLLLALIAYFAFFRGGDDADKVTKLHIADTAQSDFQDMIVEVGKENGLDIEFTNFSDPYLPNTALVEGEVDANSFQHVAWLSQFNNENGEELTPLFSTVITTWGFFSATHDSVDALPEGARIAVPDDPSNFSRSLFILENAGLIEVDDSAGVFPTEDDITDNPHNIELVRLAHESVQTAYEDPKIDGVVLGADDLDPALGITAEDALMLEDSSAESSSPYVLVVATTPDRVDDPAWEALEKTYRDERVVAALEAEKRGEATIVDIPREQLLNALEELSSQ